jgi:methionyl-tRNA formyltransferase
VARLAYLGTPDMAVPPLRALVAAGHDVALCVTRPDRRRGRGKEETPSPVKAAASVLGLAVTHDMNDLTTAGVELAVVVAYGRIIPARLLEQVPMVNLHFSLLPRWRGAAPVERAILAGDRETGVCLMKVEAGLDTGPVYAVRTVPLDDDITLAALRTELVTVASALVVDALADGVSGLPDPVPQEGAVTMADKISTEDLHLDWARSAVELKRVVRLGRAWTTFRGKRLTVLDVALAPEGQDPGERPAGSLVGAVVATGSGALVLRQVQPESRSPMSADDWLRGVRPAVGERLGTD